MAAMKCAEPVEIFFSAKDLPNLDLLSKTDPFIVVYTLNRDRSRKIIFLTEVIKDSLNPTWTKSFKVDYLFEEIQQFHVMIMDKDDGPQEDLERHQRCGETSFRLSELMCARGQSITHRLQGGTGRGFVTFKAETVSNTRDVFECTFAGSKLANKDGFFGKSDPFLIIQRIREDGTYVYVWKNEPIMNNLSPTWPLSSIPMQVLCNGDMDRPIKIDIMDWDSDGGHDPMGSVITSVRGLLDSRGVAFNVIEEKKQSKRGYTNSGTLSALSPVVQARPSFLDFITGGCEISLSVAIDFTGSNGRPDMPNSLHYLDPTGQNMNQYQAAITAVGNVVAEYDTDKRFPVYGFGAQLKLPTGGVGPVQHCFPLHGSGYEAHGIGGILAAYQQCLPLVHLAGPTIFTPLLTATIEAVRAKGGCTQAKQQYEVLLILTDGIINDMQQAIDCIVEASTLPLSIIIVGIGSADFSDMRLLDGDSEGLKSSRGVKAARDIVQFVKFSDFAAKGEASLAREVLGEVPDQLLAFMKANRIHPNEPPPPFDEVVPTLPTVPGEIDAPQGYGAPPAPPQAYTAPPAY